MIKLFVHTNHRELEILVNNWISSNSITVIDIRHFMCVYENNVLYSIIIHYHPQDSIPC